jgi:hypothetical protein
MSPTEEIIPEQERLNHLIARFLRLNDGGKIYINNIIRQLAGICGPPVTSGCGIPPAREEVYQESKAASGFDGMEGICGLQERNAASL